MTSLDQRMTVTRTSLVLHHLHPATRSLLRFTRLISGIIHVVNSGKHGARTALFVRAVAELELGQALGLVPAVGALGDPGISSQSTTYEPSYHRSKNSQESTQYLVMVVMSANTTPKSPKNTGPGTLWMCGATWA